MQQAKAGGAVRVCPLAYLTKQFIFSGTLVQYYNHQISTVSTIIYLLDIIGKSFRLVTVMTLCSVEAWRWDSLRVFTLKMKSPFRAQA